MTALPLAPVTVHLLRHGLVDNPQGILYGRLPGFHLSEIGRQMAERAASHFAQTEVAYLAVSPLERAQETAAPLAAAQALTPVVDQRLIEPVNVFEGKVFGVGDGVLRQPRNWRKVRDPFTPSWGEPYLSVARRMVGAVYTAVQEVGSAAGGGQAVLVSHQLPIWTLRRFFEGKHLWHNPAKRQCGLASLTSLHFTDGVVIGIEYQELAADLVPGSAAGVAGA